MCRRGLTLTALLLSGGESRRMGSDKALLGWEGRPLWEHQLRTLRDVRPERLRVSARIPPAWCPPDADLVLDPAPSWGPLSGLVAGLHSLRTSHLLVLAIDLPLMTSHHLRQLWTRTRPGRGVVPVAGGRPQPLAALYPAVAAVAAAEALWSDDRSLRGLVRRLEGKGLMDICTVRSEDAPLYGNVNTPAELAHAHRALTGMSRMDDPGGR